MRVSHMLLPVAAVSFLALDSCGDNSSIGADPLCSTATFDIDGRRVTTFGTSADARKVQAFLQATIDLDRAVDDVGAGMLQSCRAIGADLGLTNADYVPAAANELPVVTVCNRVIREVRTVIQAGLPTGARLDVQVSPPVCRVDINFGAQCVAECTGSVMVMVPRCTGTVVADCNGTCDATCSGSCSGGCTGQCSGTCTGQCMGTCTGTCTGTCSQMDGTGRCIGTCMGTCAGSCSANCMGSCAGSCTAGCQGSCMGQCRGSCSVASNVRCDGMWAVDGDVECQAACRARAQAQATCTEARVGIAASASVNPAGRARLETLIGSLQRNYPLFVSNAQRIQTLLTETAPAFAASVQGAADAAGNVSATASACIARAAIAAASTSLEFRATVEVNVSFTGAIAVQGM